MRLSVLTILIIIILWLAAGCGRGNSQTEPLTEQPSSPAMTTRPATPVEKETPAFATGETWTRPADGVVMVYVPTGSFQMGSDFEQSKLAWQLCKTYSGDLAISTCRQTSFTNEQPAHRVMLDGFWIDRTEVTIGAYHHCETAGACTPPVEIDSYTRESYYQDSAYDDYPVVWVTWQQASDYCAWAGARLPTEAEWEYAARGPESLIFPWGDSFDGTSLNYCDANCPIGLADMEFDDGYSDTAPVGSYPAGASWVGALDMAGNVREWVADWFAYYPSEEQVNPTGPVVGSSRVPRGGSWLDMPDDVRAANRGENEPDYRRHKVGFRCARDGE